MAKKIVTSLGSIRIVKYIGKITQHPNRKTSISNLEIICKLAVFQPLVIRTGLARKKQILLLDSSTGVSCVLYLSEDVQIVSGPCNIWQLNGPSYRSFIFH